MSEAQERIARSIFGEHIGGVERIARSLSGRLQTVADREDYLQDVRIRTLQTIRHRVAERRLINWPPYLSTIPNSIILTRHKFEGRQAHDSFEDRVRDIGRVTKLEPQETASELVWHLVREAIGHPQMAETFETVHRHGLSYSEAAARLNRPVGTIRSQMNRATAKLAASEQADHIARLAAEINRVHEEILHTVILQTKHGGE
ncbi:hypothetical protein AUJ14_06125 [Candidatus Micrarchaeota archaeon CG1_02_55_22]|nr:MAG: hypothetical protein AUJ14_06125 [Candidatus Micrarchaeota archaeon CG1_02_55_22]